MDFLLSDHVHFPPHFWVGIMPSYRNPDAYTVHVLDQDEYEGFHEDYPHIHMYDAKSLPLSYSLFEKYVALNRVLVDIDDDDERGCCTSLVVGIRRQIKEIEDTVVPYVKARNAGYERLMAAYIK